MTRATTDPITITLTEAELIALVNYASLGAAAHAGSHAGLDATLPAVQYSYATLGAEGVNALMAKLTAPVREQFGDEIDYYRVSESGVEREPYQ